MTCFLAREQLAAFLQQQLHVDQAAVLRRHLLDCGACHDEYEYQARLSSSLRDLGRVEPPPALATAIRLRVSAHKQSTWTHLWQRWQVHLANLMRPVALPAAGGLLTALILFLVLMPSVWVARSPGRDVPTALSTDPQFKQASVLPVYEDVLVEAWIDQQGKIAGYQVLNGGQNGAKVSQTLGYQAGDVLLTTIFKPATSFGQPIAGKVLLSFRRINIHG
jgi:anti-sigma factor RsiW